MPDGQGTEVEMNTTHTARIHSDHEQASEWHLNRLDASRATEIYLFAPVAQKPISRGA